MAELCVLEFDNKLHGPFASQAEAMRYGQVLAIEDRTTDHSYSTRALHVPNRPLTQGGVVHVPQRDLGVVR